jgi:hypothetical protein
MQIHFITPDHALWGAATVHVATVFARAHDAAVTEFAPEMAVATNAHGAVVCAAGLRAAARGLFSQVYLDRPV